MNTILEFSDVVEVAVDADCAILKFIDEPDLAWVGGGDLSNGY
ncbi:MAG: hypothetical protein ACR2GP_03065 [Burkholderiaceae bacterium]